ncbi:MAG: polysaccharide biosynthesis protein [Clostridia bacterium]|nr:polysaccharide biosynthesis protein [Clostridia bacterium]
MFNKKSNEKGNIKKGTFMGNVLVIMFSQVLIRVLGLVYRIYLTNRQGFGDTGNALYSAGYQIYSLLLLLSSIGIPSAVAKLVSEKVTLGDYKGATKTFKISLTVVSCAGLIGSLLLFLGAGFISDIVLKIPDAKMTIMAIAPSIFFVAISSVIRGYFNGRNTMKPTANSQSLEQILKTIFTVVFVEIAAATTSTSTVAMAVAANIATTVSVISSFVYIFLYFRHRAKFINQEMRSQVEYKPEHRKKILKRVLSVAIPISLTSIIVSINKTIDAITVPRSLMTFLSYTDAMRIYGVLSGKVDTIGGLPLSFNTAFSVALVPELAALKAINDKTGIAKKINISMLLTILIAFPCTVGLCIFAQPILDLIFPNANFGAYILAGYAFTIVFTMLGQNMNAALQGLDKLKTPVIALAIGSFVKFLANIILVPIQGIGIYGAIIGSILCYSFVLGMELITLKKMINIKYSIIKLIIKPLIASGIMGAVSYLIYTGLLNIIVPKLATIIALFSAVIVYALCVVYLNILSEEDYLAMPKGNKIYKIVSKLPRPFKHA